GSADAPVRRRLLPPPVRWSGPATSNNCAAGHGRTPARQAATSPRFPAIAPPAAASSAVPPRRPGSGLPPAALCAAARRRPAFRRSRYRSHSLLTHTPPGSLRLRKFVPHSLNIVRGRSHVAQFLLDL